MTAPLQIQYRPQAALKRRPSNARTHSEAQIAQIAASIREFGWTNPVLIDEDDQVIAGHGRLDAAELLNLQEVPTICVRGLSETQRRALVIADNQLPLGAGWDDALLSSEIQALQAADFKIELLGFDAAELDALIHPKVQESSTREVDVDAFELVHSCARCGFEFNTAKGE